MKLMTAHFASSSDVTTLGALMSSEIADNKKALPEYKDWSIADREMILPILDQEESEIKSLKELSSFMDSVKGEEAMLKVYPSVIRSKATDAITRLPAGLLVLSEAKYLMRFGGKGPFRGMASFKERVSSKFLEMANVMLPDQEQLSSLRVIVVTDLQLPISINHVKALVARKDPVGSYSEDGKAYEYVLCSSVSLRKIIDNPNMPRVSTANYLFFTL